MVVEARLRAKVDMKSTAPDEPIVIAGEPPAPAQAGVAAGPRQLRWKVAVGALATLVVFAVLAQFGEGRRVDDLGGVPDSTTDVRAEQAVEAWVWAALAGDATTAGRLAYRDDGPSEDLGVLAQLLAINLETHGPPLIRIEANPATVSPEYVCVDLSFGAERIAGAMIVRTWPDIGRRLYRFSTSATGCPMLRQGADESLVERQRIEDTLLSEQADVIRSTALDVVSEEPLTPLGFDNFVLVFSQGEEFALRGRAVFPSGCRWLGLAGRNEGGSIVVSGALVNDGVQTSLPCATD